MDIMFTLFDQEWVTQVHEKNLIKETATAARREGELEGRRESTLDSLRNLMDSLGLSSDQAMSALKIPASEQSEYHRLLELRQ